jgi:CDP-glucose 4,6-dehydratase
MEGLEMSFWRGKCVLVTRAAGLVASWSDNDFIKSKAPVSALNLDGDQFSQLMRSNDIEKISVVKRNLDNYLDLTRVISRDVCSSAIHITAKTIVGSALLDLLSTLESNLKGKWNILEATHIAGVKIG